MINKLKSLTRRSIRNSFLAAELIYYTSEISILSSRIKIRLRKLYLTLDGSHIHNNAVLEKLVLDQSVSINSNEIEIRKGSVIKAPNINGGKVIHKGIILVGFEYELEKLAQHSNLDFVSERYNILFMPTWQPFYSDELSKFLQRAQESIYILPSSQQCFYQGVQDHKDIKMLPFHASSWVTEDRFDKSVTTKDIDLLMVANFSTYKRHKLLFKALADLPTDLNVIIAGRPLKHRDRHTLMAEAREYGVENRFTLIESPSDDELVNLVTRSKLNLGLSAREGSYVALAEALIADTPVALFKNAVVGTKNYINPETGFLLDEDIPLAPQIQKCLNLLYLTSPRAWAIKNISLEHNFQKLVNYFPQENNSAPIEAFYINNFEVLSKENGWSESIINSAKELKSQGIVFKNNFPTQTL